MLICLLTIIQISFQNSTGEFLYLDRISSDGDLFARLRINLAPLAGTEFIAVRLRPLLKEENFRVSITNGKWRWDKWALPELHYTLPMGSAIVTEKPFCNMTANILNDLTAGAFLNCNPVFINQNVFFCVDYKQSLCIDIVNNLRKYFPCGSGRGLSGLIGQKLFMNSYTALILEVKDKQLYMGIDTVFDSNGQEAQTIDNLFGSSIDDECAIPISIYVNGNKQESIINKLQFDSPLSALQEMPVLVQQYIKDAGSQNGLLVFEIINKMNKNVSLSFYQFLPDCIWIQMHTLKSTTNLSAISVDDKHLSFKLNTKSLRHEQIEVKFKRKLLNWYKFQRDIDHRGTAEIDYLSPIRVIIDSGHEMYTNGLMEQ
ncbi:hypothetical protein GJ496_008192 [Pomphorhynchus laevis]|nr:hypothetical protein GJ496_008192 [Pomphorhynchus laevis]